ncbi:hypothetical protein [Reichenbachiella sp.]|uniref:tetratricopeptide repeat protein n=1 Tax=Reichenbachiella sp. TaxID=2184521 RepID=UPI003298E7F9
MANRLKIHSFFGFVLFGIALVFQSCETRLGTAPIPIMTTKAEPPLESIVISNRELNSFNINELIQYVKIHENSNWENISEEEVLNCLKLSNNDVEILQLVSDFYLTKGNLKESLRYNTEAENGGANSTEFYKKRASIYSALGEYGLAIDYINKAVMINGNDPDIYLTKGEVYMRLGDSASALQYKEQAFKHDTSRQDIASDLAHLYASTKQNQKAHDFADLLIDAGYLESEMNFLKVDLLRKDNQDDEANQLLTNMLYSGEVKAGDLLIDYYESKNNYDSMIFYATQVLTEDSLNMKALKAKAFSFDQKGYFSSSLMYYDQMLTIDSLNEEAIEGIRKVNGKIAYLRKLRERREAIPTFDFASPRKETN